MCNFYSIVPQKFLLRHLHRAEHMANGRKSDNFGRDPFSYGRKNDEETNRPNGHGKCRGAATFILAYHGRCKIE